VIGWLVRSVIGWLAWLNRRRINGTVGGWLVVRSTDIF